MKKLETIKDYTIMLLFISGATMFGTLFRYHEMNQTNVAVVYILSVLLTACFTRGYLPGIVASVLSMMAFSWFYTAPYHAFSFYNPRYLVTFCIMTVTSVITSALTTKIKKAAADANLREAVSNILYRMTNELTDAEDMKAIAVIMVKTVSSLLSCHVAFIFIDEEGNPEPVMLRQNTNGTREDVLLEDAENMKKRMEGLRGCCSSGPEYSDWPIYGRKELLGILRIPAETAAAMPEGSTRMLLSMIESASLAIERQKSLKLEAKNREEVERERYRSNLLRSISHDIRTPLSGIMGSSEMLMHMTEKKDPRYPLELDIYRDAEWLHTLVENILSLTRLDDGHLVLVKEPEAVEEIIGVLTKAMEKRLPDRDIQVDIPDTLLLVPMDGRLILQVLVNLLDNAAAHSPEGSPIEIEVKELPETNEVQFKVADRGKGFRAEELPMIFNLFFTTRTSDHESGRRGMGLGLPICQSVVEAHGGKICARNREDGKGAEVIFTLPMEGERKA